MTRPPALAAGARRSSPLRLPALRHRALCALACVLALLPLAVVAQTNTALLAAECPNAKSVAVNTGLGATQGYVYAACTSPNPSDPAVVEWSGTTATTKLIASDCTISNLRVDPATSSVYAACSTGSSSVFRIPSTGPAEGAVSIDDCGTVYGVDVDTTVGVAACSTSGVLGFTIGSTAVKRLVRSSLCSNAIDAVIHRASGKMFVACQSSNDAKIIVFHPDTYAPPPTEGVTFTVLAGLKTTGSPYPIACTMPSAVHVDQNTGVLRATCVEGVLEFAPNAAGEYGTESKRLTPAQCLTPTDVWGDEGFLFADCGNNIEAILGTTQRTLNAASGCTVQHVAVNPSASAVYTACEVGGINRMDVSSLISSCPKPTPPTGTAAGTCTANLAGWNGHCTFDVSAGYVITDGQVNMKCANGQLSDYPDIDPIVVFSMSLPSKMVVAQPSGSITVTPTSKPIVDVELSITCKEIADGGNAVVGPVTVTPNVLPWTADDATPADYSFTAPATAGHTIACAFVVTPDPASRSTHFTTPSNKTITIVPQSNLTVSTALGAAPYTVAINQFLTTLSVKPVEATFFKLNVSITCMDGTNSGPLSTLQWEANSDDEQQFAITAPATAGEYTCTFSLAEQDAPHYILPAPFTIHVKAQSSFSVDALPSKLAVNQDSLAISVKPAELPFLTGDDVTKVGVTVDIVCTGGAQANPSKLKWLPTEEELLPQTFVLTAGNTVGPFECAYNLVSNDAAHYASIPTASFDVVAQSKFTIASLPPKLAVGQTLSALSIAPAEDLFLNGVNVSLVCSAGTVTGGAMVWTSGKAAKSFSFEAPSDPTTVTCTFDVTGNDAKHYATPATWTIAVSAKATIAVQAIAPKLAINEKSLDSTITPSEAPFLTSVTVTIACTLGTPSPTSVMFTTATAQSWTYTAPATPTNSDNDTCTFTLSGADKLHYDPISSVSVIVVPQSAFTVVNEFASTPAKLAYGMGSKSIKVTPNEATFLNGLTLTITCKDQANVPLTSVAVPTTLVWPADDATEKSWELTAPSSPSSVTSIVCTYTASGSDADHYVKPSDLSVDVKALSTLAWAPTGPLPANASVTVTATPSEAPFLKGNGVKFEVDCTHGTVPGFVPLVWTTDAAAKTYTYKAPDSASNSPDQCTVTPSGDSAAQYATTNFNANVVILKRFYFSPPDRLSVSEWSTAIVVTPSDAPAAGKTAILSVTCNFGGAVQDEVMAFDSANGVGPKAWSVTSGANTGTMTCSFAVTGTEAAGWAKPADVQITVFPVVDFNIAAVPNALAMLGNTGPIAVMPGYEPFLAGVTLSLACTGGVVSPPSLTWAAKSVVPQFWNYTAPAGWGVTIVCTYTVTGTDAAHFRVPIPIYIHLEPEVPFLMTPLPSTVAQGGQSQPMTVAPSALPLLGGVTLTISCVQGLPSTAAPVVMNFAAGSMAPQSWTYSAPAAVSAPDTCSFVVSGTDAIHFTKPNDAQVTIVATAQFTLQSVPTKIAVLGTTGLLSITPSAAPLLSGVTLSISCTGTGSVSPSLLAWEAGVTTPQLWSYRAGNDETPVTCTFVIGGTDTAHYEAVPPVVIDVQATSSFDVTAAEAAIAVNQGGQVVTVTPKIAPLLNGVTLTVSCTAGVASPRVLSWSAGNVDPLPWTYTAPSASLGVVCSYTVSGSDAIHFTAPEPLAISIVPEAHFVLLPLPAVLAVSESSATLTVVPSARPLLTGVTLTVTCVQGTATPTMFPFPAGSMVPQTWVYTAPASAAASPDTCSFAVGGSDVIHFAQPASMSVVVVAAASLTLQPSPSALAAGGTTGALTITPSAKPHQTLTVEITCTAGTVNNAKITWTAGDDSTRTWTFNAPSDAVGTNALVTCNFAVTSDFAHFSAPAPRSFIIHPTSSFSISPVTPDLAVHQFSGPITVTPLAEPLLTGVTLWVTCTGGAQVTGALMTWEAEDITPRQFNVQAPGSVGTVWCSYAVNNTDAVHFVVPEPHPITVVPVASFAVSVFPSSLAVSEYSGLITVTPSAAPFFSGVTLTVSCKSTNPVWAAPDVTLTWPAANADAKTWSLTAPTQVSAVTCSYTLLGSDVAHYNLPSAHPLSVVAQSSFTVSDVPVALAVNQFAGTFSVQPNEAPFLTGVQMRIECTAGAVTGGEMTWAAGDATGRTWTYTAPATPAAAVTCTYTTTGTDKAHYAVPTEVTISVAPLAAFTVGAVPAALAVNEDSLVISVQPTAGHFLTGVLLSIACSHGAVATPNVLSWTGGSTSSQSWLLTAPSTPSTVTCAYTVGGSDYEHYTTPSSHTIVIHATSAFSIVNFPSALAVNVWSGEVLVTPLAPTFLTGVTLTIACSEGELTNSQLTWTAGEAHTQILSYTAPVSTANAPVTCTFAVNGTDKVHYAVPAPRTVAIVPTATFDISHVPTELVFGAYSGEVRVLPSAAALLTGVTLNVSCTNGSVTNPTLFWPAGDASVRSWGLTAPTFPAQNVTCTYQLFGTDAGHYELPVGHRVLIRQGQVAPTVTASVLIGASYAPFATRSGFGAAACGSELVLLGGSNYASGGVGLNDVWAYNGSHWRQVTPAAPWAGRVGLQAIALTPTLVLVVGGTNLPASDPLSTPHTDAWLMQCSPGSSARDGQRYSWLLLANDAPWATRSDFGAVVINSRVYIMGGRMGATLLNDVWSSQIDTTATGALMPMGANAGAWRTMASSYISASKYLSAWQRENDGAWSPRAGFMAAVLNGALYLIGGEHAGNSPTSVNEVWKFQPSSGFWMQLPSTPFGSRTGAGAAVWQGVLLVLGGVDYDGTIGSSQYQFDGTVWTPVSGGAETQRVGAQLLVFDNHLVLLGGTSAGPADAQGDMVMFTSAKGPLAQTEDDDDGLTDGEIAAIVVCSFVFLLIVIAVVGFYVRRNQKAVGLRPAHQSADAGVVPVPPSDRDGAPPAPEKQPEIDVHHVVMHTE